MNYGDKNDDNLAPVEKSAYKIAKGSTQFLFHSFLFQTYWGIATSAFLMPILGGNISALLMLYSFFRLYFYVLDLIADRKLTKDEAARKLFKDGDARSIVEGRAALSPENPNQPIMGSIKGGAKGVLMGLWHELWFLPTKMLLAFPALFDLVGKGLELAGAPSQRGYVAKTKLFLHNTLRMVSMSDDDIKDAMIKAGKIENPNSRSSLAAQPV